MTVVAYRCWVRLRVVAQTDPPSPEWEDAGTKRDVADYVANWVMDQLDACAPMSRCVASWQDIYYSLERVR